MVKTKTDEKSWRYSTVRRERSKSKETGGERDLMANMVWKGVVKVAEEMLLTKGSFCCREVIYLKIF